MPAYLDTSSRVTRFSNQTFGHLHTFVHLGQRSVRNNPPPVCLCWCPVLVNTPSCLSDLRALSEKDDVPRRGRVGSPRLLQGSLSDYMPNICASPAGSGSVSPAEALAVACTLTNRR